ncbi:putative formate/nitrite transporter [Vararia minispora EC-137]|uniref:Formate/nitrite transporter n=1 Tax=Vararia minispora EC-137 TaxID=1314806 RepID=A0ACB8Q5B4_9AGAM|nr:putative formate/nitrite transporter [Vararia minispora EC-137]
MYTPTPSTLKPNEVAAVLVETAVLKHHTRYDKTFFKAFLAGVMLSFGGLLSEIIQGGSQGINSSNPGLVKILGGFVFPVGLVMIVLQGQELLTSNMMTFPMALLTRSIPVWSLPVNWIIVMFGNLVGSLFFAAILVRYTGIISMAPYDEFVREFAIKKAGTPEWHQVFLRGIGCNWLVSIAIWQSAGARDTVSKIYAIWIPIWIFVACGYDHVVANMFSVPLGIMFHANLTTAQYIRKRVSFIAAFIGNVVGALFVALPAWYFYLLNYNSDTPLDRVEQGEASDNPGDSSANSLTKKRVN